MKRAWILLVILGLIVEKILQHGLTSLFFVVPINGIGAPDIGNRVILSDPIMAVLNFVLMGLFIWGFYEIWKFKTRGLYLVFALCLFDILAEFIFHGFIFVTVSIIIATLLICLIVIFRYQSIKMAKKIARLENWAMAAFKKFTFSRTRL